MNAVVELDELDRRILRALQIEGRITYDELAGRVSLSLSAVLRRVKHLEESGALVAVPLRDCEMNERHLEVQTLAGRTLPPACKAFLDQVQELLRQG
jgi:DNA-binding Lrp family transcriptional regulator